jgi:hypothetical protein
MALPIVIGIVVALVATALVVAAQRAPTRLRCPECGAATQAVVPPPLLRRAAPGVQIRWCPSCSWEGLGRAGPEWVSGRRIAHDSGFHWGAERFPEDFGFRWRPLRDLGGAGAMPSADHPSGFRFAAVELDPSSPAHSSGFAWARGPAEAQPDASGEARAAAVFEWGRRKAPRSFVWRSPRKKLRSGFHWKGVA